MSRFDEETIMGGPRGSFQTTQWSQIQSSRTSDEERRKASINNLLGRYWKPVYCYLRYKGYDSEEAKDLTQGFFHEIVLGRELIQHANQKKGRFRTFLLTALDRYVVSVYRKEISKKRSPQQVVSPLEVAELPDTPIAHLESNPNQVFHYAWATNLLDRVLEQIRDDYCSTDRSAFWQLFQARVLKPIFDNAQAPSLTELCNKYHVDNERKASNMIMTVKRRFSTAMRHYLRQYVQNDSEVEDEFCELMDILSKGSAI